MTPTDSLGECIACGGDMHPDVTTLRLDGGRVMPLLGRRCISCGYETTTDVEAEANDAITRVTCGDPPDWQLFASLLVDACNGQKITQGLLLRQAEAFVQLKAKRAPDMG